MLCVIQRTCDCEIPQVCVLKEHSQVPLSTVMCIFRDSDFVTSDQASCGLPANEF